MTSETGGWLAGGSSIEIKANSFTKRKVILFISRISPIKVSSISKWQLSCDGRNAGIKLNIQAWICGCGEFKIFIKFLRQGNIKLRD